MGNEALAFVLVLNIIAIGTLAACRLVDYLYTSYNEYKFNKRLDNEVKEIEKRLSKYI